MWAFPQVTERLLDSEEHKLKLLKTEIEVGRHRSKDGDVSQTKVGSTSMDIMDGLLDTVVSRTKSWKCRRTLLCMSVYMSSVVILLSGFYYLS